MQTAISSCRLGIVLLTLLAALPAVAAPAASTAEADALFAAPRILALKLDIAPAELETMKQDGKAYVRCRVREGGKTYADVGVHYKGKASAQAVSAKPAFTLKFNEFAHGQTFHGLQRLSLENCLEDPAYLSLPLAHELFRAAGVPAARCGFARVELNGRDLGFYVLTEAVNREFLARHFDKGKGNLYEGDRADVTDKLDKDGGDDRTDQPDVAALAAAATQGDASHRWKKLQQSLDMDRFLSFAAMEVLLGHKGGYALKTGKYRLYHDPVNDRMAFLPHGVDTILEKPDAPVLPEFKGVVAKAVVAAPEGQKQYRERLAKLLGGVFKPEKVQARVTELAAAIRPAAVGKDAAAGKAFDAEVARLKEAVAKRAASAAEQLKAPPAPAK
jgi:hypothetical protein